MGTRRNSGPRAGHILANNERNADLIEKCVLGASWASLAAHFKLSIRRCKQIWDAEVKRGRFRLDTVTETARAVEIEKLDRLGMLHWPRAANPESAAVLMRIADRRAALLGLDAPEEMRLLNAPPEPAKEYDLSGFTVEQLRTWRDLIAKATPKALPANETPALEHKPAASDGSESST